MHRPVVLLSYRNLRELYDEAELPCMQTATRAQDNSCYYCIIRLVPELIFRALNLMVFTSKLWLVGN